MKYGYARVSTKKQSLERQFTNILSYEPKAKIFSEKFTGTKDLEIRPEWKKLIKVVKSGDTIIFDSVSRMSRNAEDGIKTYFDLVDQGIHLVFLNERHIDSDVYQKALNNQVNLIGNEIADEFIKATNKVLQIVAKDQIKIAFDQAEKERNDISERTKEGLRETDKPLGLPKGSKLNVMKALESKIVIFEHSKTFGGSLPDPKCQKLAECSRNSFYKYKSEILNDLNEGRSTDYQNQLKILKEKRKVKEEVREGK